MNYANSVGNSNENLLRKGRPCNWCIRPSWTALAYTTFKILTSQNSDVHVRGHECGGVPHTTTTLHHLPWDDLGFSPPGLGGQHSVPPTGVFTTTTLASGVAPSPCCAARPILSMKKWHVGKSRCPLPGARRHEGVHPAGCTQPFARAPPTPLVVRKRLCTGDLATLYCVDRCRWHRGN